MAAKYSHEENQLFVFTFVSLIKNKNINTIDKKSLTQSIHDLLSPTTSRTYAAYYGYVCGLFRVIKGDCPPEWGAGQAYYHSLLLEAALKL